MNPTAEPTARTARVLTAGPITLANPRRGVDLEVKISAPATGSDLPVILFAHGFGSSLHAYGPLADHWASHGFVVIQPTFLDSRTIGLPEDDARRPQLWTHRVEDMTLILDELDSIAAALPGLEGRVDHTRVAAAGHSFGGQTAGVLLGVRVDGPDGTPGADLADPRVRAGVLLATAGRGGDDLTPEAAALFPWLNPDFSHLTSPTIVFAGDKDSSFLTTRGPDWSADPYTLSPGGRHLVTLADGEHSLGGIPGYESAETTDENPARVAAIQRLSTAFLRQVFDGDDSEWVVARDEFIRSDLGKIDSER